MFQELESDNLQEIVQNNDKVVVQYSAGWCGNCAMMKPKFKRMANEMEDMTFVLVDAEKFPNSRQLANVDNLPTFATFHGGSHTGQVQTNRAEKLKELVDALATH
jgi:thiol-disulfide isomerase/thioredoxin